MVHTDRISGLNAIMYLYLRKNTHTFEEVESWVHLKDIISIRTGIKLDRG